MVLPLLSVYIRHAISYENDRREGQVDAPKPLGVVVGA